MTPADLRENRRRLGLTQAGLAQALELGKDGARTVRWHEAKPETHAIPGPWAVAIRLMLEREHAHPSIAAETATRWSGEFMV